MVSGLGVHEVVVRYQVAAADAVQRPPNRRPVITWVPPKRPQASAPERMVTAVDGVSLSVEPGQIVALLGASGSGKSSLLRAIAGLEPLTSGRITWDGADITAVPTHKRNFGMMFQDPALFPSLTVGKNVGYGLHRIPRGERARIVAEMLELVGLPGLAQRRTTELSGGQAQRVALARSLAPRPRLLLLDEPLSALDRSLREHLVEVLGQVLRETGTTAVHVTHDQDEAFAIADKVAILAEGRLLQFGATDTLWRRPASEQVARFLGYATFLATEDAAAFGLAAEASAHRVALGPESLRVDPGGVPLRVVDQKVRRGFVQVTLILPSGTEAELRVPEKLGETIVPVSTDARSVAIVG